MLGLIFLSPLRIKCPQGQFWNLFKRVWWSSFEVCERALFGYSMWKYQTLYRHVHMCCILALEAVCARAEAGLLCINWLKGQFCCIWLFNKEAIANALFYSSSLATCLTLCFPLWDLCGLFCGIQATQQHAFKEEWYWFKC